MKKLFAPLLLSNFILFAACKKIIQVPAIQQLKALISLNTFLQKRAAALPAALEIRRLLLQTIPLIVMEVLSHSATAH